MSLAVERWPIAGSFAISRGAKTEAVVVVAELADGTARGRGECVPYGRYGETVEGVIAALEAHAAATGRRPRPGRPATGHAARRRAQCARLRLLGSGRPSATQRPVHELAGLPAPHPVTTAYTISLAAPGDMAKAAAKAASRALLKVKLGAPGDAERIAAVRRAAPKATLIVDANEGWDEAGLAANLAACAQAGVVLVEQPLPEGRDRALAGHQAADPDLRRRERARPCLAAGPRRQIRCGQHQARQGRRAHRGAGHGRGGRTAWSLGVMAGCMVATSLSMAPAVLLAQTARFVDLDGPLLLARDRDPGLRYARQPCLSGRSRAVGLKA